MEKTLEELRQEAGELLAAMENAQPAAAEALAEWKGKLESVLSAVKKLGKEDRAAAGDVESALNKGMETLMKKDLELLKQDAVARLAASVDEKELLDARIAFLGKKGRLTAILRGMKDLSAEERPVMGALANTVREEIEALEAKKKAEFKAEKLARRIREERIDITLPARHHQKGHIHPLNKALHLIMETFMNMGYSVAEGPEIEEDYYNFYCLNLPKDHPARDMQDSFYLTENMNFLLRTHTSPVQARTLQGHEPNSPIRIIAPGKVFRWDNDATHSPVFHQVEGLVVDKGIKFADLKGTLEIFLKEIFGSDTKIRFRASYFPFTEPSAEVDISFASRMHGETNADEWLEILGCGMVHPRVLSLNGYDPAKVSGFAFGMGVERIAMLLYGIDDLRLFYENDMRFLKQF